MSEKRGKGDHRTAAEAITQTRPDLVERARSGDEAAAAELLTLAVMGAEAIRAAREAMQGGGE